MYYRKEGTWLFITYLHNNNKTINPYSITFLILMTYLDYIINETGSKT